MQTVKESSAFWKFRCIIRKTMKRLAYLFLVLLLAPTLVFAKTPDDAEYDEQWYLPQIDAPGAWDTTTGSTDVVIAVLDSGFDLNHPDLEDQYFVNSEETAGNGKDDDGNGYADDVNGWDFIDDDEDPSPVTTGVNADPDAAKHGSLVAGLIAAEGDNGEGVAGVIWTARILPLRVLDEAGSGDSRAAADAIDYAVEMGADVINMSFAGDVSDSTFRNAVERAYEAGVVVVAAMGNDSVNTSSHPVYPACFGTSDDDWVIGVGSSNEDDYRSLFSNYGACTDLSAPGEDMYGVSYEDGSAQFTDEYQGGWDGTSMAAPLVSGAAALLLSQYPDLSPEDIRNILKLSVDPIKVRSSSMADKVGAGRLNVERALEYGASFSDGEEETEEEDDESATVSSGQVAPGSGEFGTSPVTGESEEISIVVPGEYIKSPSYSTVYYIPEEGERWVFMDANTYFTWSDSFGDIIEVTDATLPTLTLTGIMLPKPGVVLMKITSDPSVYAIEENPDDESRPLRRKISSEEVAIEMYGEDWADYVIDVDPTFIGRFERGDAIEEAEDVDTSIMKTREELSELAQN